MRFSPLLLSYIRILYSFLRKSQIFLRKKFIFFSKNVNFYVSNQKNKKYKKYVFLIFFTDFLAFLKKIYRICKNIILKKLKMWKRIDISFTTKNFEKKIEALWSIYNIKTRNKLIEHIINLELQRFWIEIDENED